MTSLQIPFFIGMGKNSALRSPLKNGYGSSYVVLKPSAMMVDGTSKGVRDVRPLDFNFKPSMWGDIFTTFPSDSKEQQKYAEEIETLKKEVRSILMAASSSQLLILIDKLERLGLAYHFEREIENKLERVYIDRDDGNEDTDLLSAALRFRLLRQHQYQVSCKDFYKFVDKENKFKETLCSDVAGLLSLYEAAHVRIHNEHILDEAMVFTANHLSHMLPQLETPLRQKVEHALEFPLQKNVTVLHIRFHISSYENIDSSDELVLRLAKLNFNYLQNIYRNELLQFLTWWENLDLKSKLPYARDRSVECYMCGIAHLFEPQYSDVRMVVAKTYHMLTIMDDTYDNYATIEEAELFTRALERWNMNEINVMPGCLKHMYKFILTVSEEFEREAEKQEKSYAIPYYIEAIKHLGRTYCEEQKWIRKRELPKFKDYMRHAQITTFIHVTFISVIPGLKSTTKETIQWLLSNSPMVQSVGVTARIVNDLGTYRREKRDGEVLTFVDCYMKDKGVSEEEALSSLVEIMEDKWKHINAEWVKSRAVPKEMVGQLINMLRAARMTYLNNEDGYSNTNGKSNLTPFICALLVDPPLLV